jgi:uncharacterized protein
MARRNPSPHPPDGLPDDLVRAVLGHYALPWDGIHGLPHWARVLENGLRLAAENGADPDVVRHFALFHDCRRVNDGLDLGHGKRGAEVAAGLRGTVLRLDRHRFDLLYHACELHTDGHTEGDVTVQTCWDADRLDLGRVGIRPRPERLCTPAARHPDTLGWAEARSHTRHEPPVVARWRALVPGTG